MTSLLYLVRHGRPAAGWGEDADPGLDEAGKLQARAVSDWLMARPRDERPGLVVSSPLKRCRETAAPFAAALGVSVEIDAAVGEIPTPAALAPGDRPAWLSEAMGGRWSQIAGGIDYPRWRESVVEALRGRPGAAVFSHFVAINAVVSALAGEDRVMAFRPDHTSVTVLRAGSDGLELVERGAEAATRVL
jgi:broad specificity phosphatase PhoE